MKKYSGYDSTEAATGEFEKLEPGGKICKILKVEVEDGKPYGSLMRIYFDIEESVIESEKGFYARLYKSMKEKNSAAKWLGMYYETIREDDLRFFKGMITSIEKSNPPYKWNWDEKTLKGKCFGGVFGEEEYLDNKGEVRTSVKCMSIRSVDSILEGNFNVPEKKVLPKDEKVEEYKKMVEDDTDEDLPF